MRFAGVSDNHFGDHLSHSRLRRSIPVRGEAIILSPEYLPSATVCCARGTSSPLAVQSMLSGEALQGPRGQNELGRATPTPPSGNIFGIKYPTLPVLGTKALDGNDGRAN
jgi:hypothetical protein